VRADPGDIRRFIDRVVGAFGQLYVDSSTPIAFSGDFVYRVHTAMQLPAADFEKLIGIAFRLSAASLVFTSDVVSGTGNIVPAGTKLGTTSSLTPYWLDSRQIGFESYLDRIVAPYHAARTPPLDRDGLIAAFDLASIAPFLAGSQKIAAITAEDDFILRPEDFAFLERTLGDRLVLYPTGGHCGNFRQRDVALRIQRFFRGEGIDR
jgi:hypothetical protein